MVYEGFSWPCLIFGVMWFALKNMWLWFFISLFLVFFTYGISWFVFPFFANNLYFKQLIRKGYEFL
ncbi:MAG: hypothetical protein HGB36_13435 [Chlorobiaceae bacterium]|nr:hypothetical protein [Chlorobiaceae bacterium]